MLVLFLMSLVYFCIQVVRTPGSPPLPRSTAKTTSCSGGKARNHRTTGSRDASRLLAWSWSLFLSLIGSVTPPAPCRRLSSLYVQDLRLGLTPHRRPTRHGGLAINTYKGHARGHVHGASNGPRGHGHARHPAGRQLVGSVLRPRPLLQPCRPHRCDSSEPMARSRWRSRTEQGPALAAATTPDRPR